MVLKIQSVQSHRNATESLPKNLIHLKDRFTVKRRSNNNDNDDDDNNNSDEEFNGMNGMSTYILKIDHLVLEVKFGHGIGIMYAGTTMYEEQKFRLGPLYLCAYFPSDLEHQNTVRGEEQLLKLLDEYKIIVEPMSFKEMKIFVKWVLISFSNGHVNHLFHLLNDMEIES